MGSTLYYSGTHPFCRRPRWLIRYRYGSKLRGTGLESRPGRIFIIEVVHIQCSKLFKGLECAELCIVLCGIKSPWSHSIRVGHSLDFGLSFVVILQCLCIKRRKAIITHSLTLPMGTRPICHTGIYKMSLCPPSPTPPPPPQTRVVFTRGSNPYNAELCLHKPWRPKGNLNMKSS